MHSTSGHAAWANYNHTGIGTWPFSRVIMTVEKPGLSFFAYKMGSLTKKSAVGIKAPRQAGTGNTEASTWTDLV